MAMVASICGGRHAVVHQFLARYTMLLILESISLAFRLCVFASSQSCTWLSLYRESYVLRLTMQIQTSFANDISTKKENTGCVFGRTAKVHTN